MGKRGKGRGKGGVGVVVDGVTGACQGASDRLRDLGSSAGGVAARAAEGVSSVACAAADNTTGATRRAARSTRQGGRAAGLEFTRRISGIAGAARGERPPARWPVAVGALGVGVGIGLAAGVVAGRSTRDGDDPAAAAADGGAHASHASHASQNGTTTNGSANGTRGHEMSTLPDMEKQQRR